MSSSPCGTLAKTGPYCDRCNKRIDHKPLSVGFKDYHVDCFLRPHKLPFIAARHIQNRETTCVTS